MIPRLASLTHGWGWVGGIAKRVWRLGLILESRHELWELHNFEWSKWHTYISGCPLWERNQRVWSGGGDGGDGEEQDSYGISITILSGI